MLNQPPGFLRRLRLYGLGFLLGCVLVYFLLLRGKDRTGWLPERRVKTQIDSTLSISPDIKCVLECNRISEGDLRVILKGSSVNFSESSPQKAPCPIYVLQGKLKTGEQIKLDVESCDTLSRLLKIHIPEFEKQSRVCPCN